MNAKQRERVLGYIEKGKDEGARLVLGGGRPPQFEKGFFVEPTLFADVDPDSTIAQDEIFGPVLCVIPYEDDDDAVRIANNSRYGLCGVITGADEERQLGMARAHPHRHAVGQRRLVVPPRHALRRLQAERTRAGERPGGIRGVSRDQGHRAAGTDTAPLAP